MERTFTVHTFLKDTNKGAALKPLEEAAEVFGAWQALDIEYARANDEKPHMRIMRTNLAEEIADCVTACVNLAERYEIDLNEALRMVEIKNINRGRY